MVVNWNVFVTEADRKIKSQKTEPLIFIAMNMGQTWLIGILLTCATLNVNTATTMPRTHFLTNLSLAIQETHRGAL